MFNRITELSCKEVINICDGTRYGTVNDVEVDCSCGRIISLIVHGKGVFSSVFSKCNDIIIPWESIKRIGDDIILVDFELNMGATSRKKGIFSK